MFGRIQNLAVELEHPLGLFRSRGLATIFSYVTSPKLPVAYKIPLALDISTVACRGADLWVLRSYGSVPIIFKSWLARWICVCSRAGQTMFGRRCYLVRV